MTVISSVLSEDWLLVNTKNYCLEMYPTGYIYNLITNNDMYVRLIIDLVDEDVYDVDVKSKCYINDDVMTNHSSFHGVDSETLLNITSIIINAKQH